MDSGIPYFQCQGRFSLYCGLHSVNNMLGYEAYDKEGMNNICYDLSEDLVNPHKHIFGGEYDANVLINALQNKGARVEWHDRRLPVSIDFELKKGEFIGFLVNSGGTRSIFSVLFKTSGRHWFVVKKLGEKYYLLDPSLKSFSYLGNKSNTESIMNEYRSSNAQILVVHKKLQ